MDKIDELLTRGVVNIIPDKTVLQKKLHSGEKLNIYLGIDPTATHIHLGHAVALRKLQSFAEAGHHVTFLIGDFTALIGDTSDKASERQVLTIDEINTNFQTYKQQAERLLDFSQIDVKYNSEWLHKINFEELIKLCQHFSMNDFISRELIKKRLDDGKRIGLHETLYPVMQGYDSYHLNTDIQIGGADQTFNMQAGRTLLKNWRNKESFILATDYLIGTDGRKMSKSWGNAVWLDDSPKDMFAKIMAIEDDLIIQYYTLATDIKLEQIEKTKKRLEAGDHPMPIKKDLAFQIVAELYDEQQAQVAKGAFEKHVQRKELPDEIPTVIFAREKLHNISLTELLLELDLAQSLSEAKRLIQGGGVKINSEVIASPLKSIKDLTSADEILLQVGRLKLRKIIVK